MRVAHVIASLDSRRGGPSRSSLGLSRGLTDMGNEVELLATGAEPKTDQQSGLFTKVFKRGFPEVISPSTELKQHLKHGRFDLLHNHGLWLRPLHYVHRIAHTQTIPFVVSPRGMMAPWAWSHRRRKKQLSNLFIHPGALTRASGWHATSQQEADDIRGLGFDQPICIAPNGVEVPSDQQLQIAREFWQERAPEIRNRKVALFYSRLHSKKRVVELLDLWRTCATDDWLLLVVGIPDQFTVAQLKEQILLEGSKNSILVFDGTYQPPPYAVADLFVLPSHSENFGLVVAEALASGVPVLTTDTTPWLELNERDAGWCVSYGEFDKTLAAAIQEPSTVLQRRGGLGREWVKRDFTWASVAERINDFYRQLRHP